MCDDNIGENSMETFKVCGLEFFSNWLIEFLDLFCSTKIFFHMITVPSSNIALISYCW
jgi:hypothetical protein